eukprot:g7977.t1
MALEKAEKTTEALKERNAELSSTIKESSSRLRESEEVACRRQEELRRLISRQVYTGTREVQAFATQTRGDAKELKTQLNSTPEPLGIVYKTADFTLTKIERQKERWASFAKRLGKQLELRTKEVRDLERQLANAIATCKD